jgi:hypothetical protein
MREHRTKSGRLIYYATRRELETLAGYRGNDRKGRACCPIHAGDNPTALAIDWGAGWASCWSCGDAWAIRVEDHPDTKPPQNPHSNGAKLPRPRNASRHENRRQHPVEHDLDALRAGLATALAAATARLAGSPGETYLAGRGTPLDVAQALQIGWVPDGKRAGRVVFPLTGPDGLPTSAIGRAVSDQVHPKYKALASDDGYVKTLFNGAAISQAKRSGHPVIVVEGPLDAAACVAAGLPLTVALCGKGYAQPAQFHGVQTVILALDGDDAGQAGRRTLWLDLTARGIEVLVLPAAALNGAKDLAEHWQRFHEMPGQLVARATGPHMRRLGGYPMEADIPHGRGHIPPDRRSPDEGNPMDAGQPHEGATAAGREGTVEELRRQFAAYEPAMPERANDLPADLKAEAEDLAAELGNDLDALATFWEDLHRHKQVLTSEECNAATYAIWLALAP